MNLRDEMTVEEFSECWMVDKPFAAPRDSMRYLPSMIGVTLYRSGPFQVQLFAGLPGACVPKHQHPNVDVFNTVITIPEPFRKKTDAHIPHGQEHEAPPTRSGGAYLSFQKWINGKKPTSLELDWIGEPMGVALHRGET